MNSCNSAQLALIFSRFFSQYMAFESLRAFNTPTRPKLKALSCATFSFHFGHNYSSFNMKPGVFIIEKLPKPGDHLFFTKFTTKNYVNN